MMYLITSDKVCCVESKRFIVARVENNLLFRVLLQFLSESFTELIEVAEMVWSEVEVEVLVDDIIFYMEVLAIARWFWSVTRF